MTYRYCLVKFKTDGKTYLFVAPDDWKVEAGKLCYVEGTSDIGNIVDVMIIDEDYSSEKKTRDFLKRMNQDREIKKVLSLITIENLWEEE